MITLALQCSGEGYGNLFVGSVWQQRPVRAPRRMWCRTSQWRMVSDPMDNSPLKRSYLVEMIASVVWPVRFVGMHVPRCAIATGSGLAYTLLERMLLDGALTGSWRYRVPYESGAVPRQSFADCIPAPAILAELACIVGIVLARREAKKLAYVAQLPIARIIMFAYAVVSMLLSMFFATARTHRHICPAVLKPVLRFCPFVVIHGGLSEGLRVMEAVFSILGSVG